MKKIIIGGLAAGAIAMVPGVALAGPAFADPHGFDPQQIHNVLENFGQQALQQGVAQEQAPAQAPTQEQAPAQDADAQQAPADTANQQQAAVQPVNKQRTFQIGFEGLGVNNNAQLVELRGPADKVFGGGHSEVGQKEVGVFEFIANPGGLPGIVHTKWNVLDANNAVTDTVEMDMVVLQKGPNTPPQLDLQNIRAQNMTGGVKPVQSARGKQFDSIGDVVIDFTRST